MSLTPLVGRNRFLIVGLLALTKINSYHSLSLEVWHHEPAIHHDHLANRDAWTRTRSTRESSWNQEKRFRFQICPLLFFFFKCAVHSCNLWWRMRKRGSRWRKRTVTFVVRHMHGLGDFQKRNKLIHKHISDRNTTFSHQTESSSSLSGLPSSSKWKSIVMLASESCAEAKFVTDRVGMPIALSTEKKKHITEV